MAAQEPPLTARHRLAVVDVGSNSVRLFLCEGADRAGPVGVRRSTVIGLRRGAAADGALAPDALERLEDALAAYADEAAAFAPDRVVAVCTSAVRDAPNRALVVGALERLLSAETHVLSGEREAALSFSGASLAVDHDAQVLVIDVGGGSTELVTGAAGVRRSAVSLDLGAVRHTERHVHSDPPAPGELAAVRREAIDAVAAHREPGDADRVAVAVAGTATTLAAIDLGGYDPRRVHRHRMTLGRVRQIADALGAVPLARRREIPGLEPARAGVIPAGATILAAVLEATGHDEVMVSERDILDGVALAAMAGPDASFQM